MPMISNSLDQVGGKILQKLRYAACLIFPLFIAKPLAAVELQFGCNYAIAVTDPTFVEPEIFRTFPVRASLHRWPNNLAQARESKRRTWFFAQLHARAIASAKASMTAPPTTSPPATNLLSFTQPLRNYQTSSYRAQYQTAKASFCRKFPSTRQLRAVLYINERRDITQNACSRGWGRKQYKVLKTDSCFAANTPATLRPKIKKPVIRIPQTNSAQQNSSSHWSQPSKEFSGREWKILVNDMCRRMHNSRNGRILRYMISQSSGEIKVNYQCD